LANCKTTGVFQPSHYRGLLYDAIHWWMTGRMTGWMTGRMDGWKASFFPQRPLIYKMLHATRWRVWFLVGSLSSLWLTSFGLLVLSRLWCLPLVSLFLPFFGCFLFIKFGRISSLVNHFEVSNNQAYRKQIVHGIPTLPFIAVHCLNNQFKFLIKNFHVLDLELFISMQAFLWNMPIHPGWA
jgi:hypothetical protein